MTVEQIAQVAHEINKAFCESIGDTSQLSWTDAPEWQRTSAINGVKFHLDNPDASPSASHESWLKEKEEQGWKYGEVKDADKKEHPCFVPYEQLPVQQRSKDYLFKQVVHSLKVFKTLKAYNYDALLEVARKMIDSGSDGEKVFKLIQIFSDELPNIMKEYEQAVSK